MPWATPTDFGQAIQDPAGTLGDEELRHGEVARNKHGLPMLWSGNFASVYRIHCPSTGKTWALKCFTREIGARQERYRHIAAALEAARLPFTVPFHYLERGIQIRGKWYPAVKMEWVEGQTLNRFVEASLEKPKMLRQLLDLWPKLAARLRDAQIAHADLQHGNVLLVSQPDGRLALKLIDYDGMWVPSLAGTQSGEIGHPNYQHPLRLQNSVYSADVDRFSHLVIYCAVSSLIVGKRGLWRQFNNDENLLFRDRDFQFPRRSNVFRALWEMGGDDFHRLVSHLVMACRGPLEASPWLDGIVEDGQAMALAPDRQEVVQSLMRRIEVDEVISDWLGEDDQADPVPAPSDEIRLQEQQNGRRRVGSSEEQDETPQQVTFAVSDQEAVPGASGMSTSRQVLGSVWRAMVYAFTLDLSYLFNQFLSVLGNVRSFRRLVVLLLLLPLSVVLWVLIRFSPEIYYTLAGCLSALDWMLHDSNLGLVVGIVLFIVLFRLFAHWLDKL